MSRRGVRKYSPLTKGAARSDSGRAAPAVAHQGVSDWPSQNPLRQAPEGFATTVASPSFPLW